MAITRTATEAGPAAAVRSAAAVGLAAARSPASLAAVVRSVIVVGLAAAMVMLAACSAAPGSRPSPPGQPPRRPALPRPGPGPPRPTPGGPASGEPASGRPASGGPSAGGPAADPSWLLTRAALAQLAVAPGAGNLLRRDGVYQLLEPGQQPLPGVALPGIATKRVVAFASASALTGAVAHGAIPAGAYGVLYDPEVWPFTPAAEQRDPVAAATRAAAVAHAHGLRFLVAPALNLTTVAGARAGTPRWERFLSLGLPRRLARVADVFEIQAQSLERDTGTYTRFVKNAVDQSKSANPAIRILAGLSTNPPGAPVPARRLTDAIAATRSRVDGYWLNVPAPGPRCPACNPRRPSLAITALRALP